MNDRSPCVGVSGQNKEGLKSLKNGQNGMEEDFEPEGWSLLRIFAGLKPIEKKPRHKKWPFLLTEAEMRCMFYRFYYKMKYQEIGKFLRDDRIVSKQRVEQILKESYKKIKSTATRDKIFSLTSMI